MRILFVCLGNICRSPAAEGVTRHLAKAAGLDLTLDSAGTSGFHKGEPPTDAMQKEAAKHGYDYGELRSRPFVAADFDRFDLIIGMDQENIRQIEAQRPRGNTVPVRLFMSYSDRDTDIVPDPYYTGEYPEAFDLIEDAARGLVSQLEQ